MKHLDDAFRYRHRLGIVGGFSLLLAISVAAALLTLCLFLADYQNSLPKNLAHQIFSAYQSGNAKVIREYSVNLPEILENPVLFAKYYAENTDLSNLYFHPGITDDPTELCYEFVSGSDPIATLTLRNTGLTSRFNFPQYEIAAITGYPLTDYKITAPSDTVLFVNGKLLSERYRTDEQSSVNNFSVLKNTIFKTKTYEITDFSYIDELGVFSKDNCECAVIWSTDRRSAIVEKRMSAQQQTEITAFAEQFSEAYSVFATKQYGAQGPVLRLLQPGTPFYNAMLLYKNDWGENYANDLYKNRVIDRLMQYSPTEFSCDVNFDYVIRFQDGLEKTYPYSMTYYLTNRDGRLLLVDMQTQEEIGK